MGTVYSDQMTNVLAVPSVALDACDHHARLRCAKFSKLWAAAGSSGDTVQLVKLPAGRVRFIGKLSYCYHNLTEGSQTVDIGWAAYVNLAGTTVVADPDGLDDGVSAETAGCINMGTVAAVAAVGYMKTFESQTGVIITLTSVGTPGSADYIYGDIVYALD